ncbi:MAG: class I SAM-dependent methyltransferase [Bacteroidales bacterium]|nr:class I SAM-dependent methyltransferase [Bacteroidales bacterium]
MSDFDNKAKTWDNDPMKTERARSFANVIRQQLDNKAGKALEFGCGTGLLSFELKDDFNSITLVDESSGMIEVLKDKIQEHQLTHFDPQQIDILSKKSSIDNNFKDFNAIYTLMTMHHVMDLEHAFKTFHNILEKDGLLLIADLEKEDGSFHAEHSGFKGHLGFDREELEELLNTNGFNVESYQKGFVIEKMVKEQTKRYPLFFITARKN